MGRLSAFGAGTMSYTPDGTGNILTKPGVGTYTYGEIGARMIGGQLTGTAGPHEVTSIALEAALAQVSGTSKVHYTYDANGNMITGPAWTTTSGTLTAYDRMRTVLYWQSNQPYQISDPAANMTFYYGADGSLVKQYDSEVAGGETLETDYMGSYEVVKHHTAMDPGGAITKTELKHYFVGGNGKVAVFTLTETPAPAQAQSTAGTTGTGTSSGGMELSGTALSSSATTGATMQGSYATYYLLDDGLGSTEVITDSTGTVLKDGSGNETGRYSYDAWGLRRNAENWGAPPPVPNPDKAVTEEGYTGHEELESVQLVHMGGRVYDPVIGRVMTADPEVQAPQMSQSYNRYSYCVNNPTSLTDPTGYEFAWGPLFFGGFSAISEVNNFAKNTGNWISGNWKTVVTVVAVVVVTVVTYGVLTAPTLAGMSAFSAGIVAGAAGGVLQGTMSTGLNGGSVTQMMESSAEDAAISAGTALLTEGAAVGIQDLQIPAPEAGYAMRLANGVIQGGVSEIRARGREGSTPDY